MAELPWPDDWRRPLLGSWYVTGVLAAILVFFVPQAAARSFMDGDASSAGLATVLLLGFGPVAWHCRPRRPQPLGPLVQVNVAGVLHWGVRFPVRTPMSAAANALSVLGLVVVAGVAVLFVFAPLDQDQLVALVILVVVVAAVSAGIGIVELAARRRRDAVELTPRHVVLRLGRRPLALAWDQVDVIRAGPGRSRATTEWSIPNCLVFVASPGVTFDAPTGTAGVLRWLGVDVPSRAVATVVATQLMNDPVVVYHALQFYLRHPEARRELGDGRALRRLAAGDMLG